MSQLCLYFKRHNTIHMGFHTNVTVMWSNWKAMFNHASYPKRLNVSGYISVYVYNFRPLYILAPWKYRVTLVFFAPRVSVQSEKFKEIYIWLRLYKPWIALITIQRINIRETNYLIHWIKIYPVDSVIHLSNDSRALKAGRRSRGVCEKCVSSVSVQQSL